jgi:D-alanine-D-alanine ligase
MLRVLHLVGSAQSPFMADLSRLYARDCLTTTFDPERYGPLIADVDPDGRWRFVEDLSDAALQSASALDLPAALREITGLAVDVMVPHMFCLEGMTTYRALFDALRIPYVGNVPATMAIGADKARARAIVASAGVPVARAELAHDADAVTLSPPLVVKPVDGDNSAALALVRDRAQLAPAIAAASGRRPALVEQYVPLGREVRCGVLERDGELRVLPLEEYAVGEDKPIRDAADKLRRAGGDGDLELVAKDATHAWIVDPGDSVNEAVGEMARRAHVALDCRHYSLFDFRIDPAGRPVFLEAGLYCSFAAQSVIATMARAAGIATPELFADAIAAALAPPSTERRTS